MSAKQLSIELQAAMPTIDFEGKQVIPKKGLYRCPFHCGAPGYAAKTWKTEAGFRKHMAACPKSPSALKRQKERIGMERAEYEQRKADALAKVTQKVGDEVFWVREIIVRDCYEQWGTRRVRVRYEPVKRFEARRDKIESIDYEGYSVYFNHRALGFTPWTICDSMEDARTKAKEKQRAYDEWCEEAARCR